MNDVTSNDELDSRKKNSTRKRPNTSNPAEDEKPIEKKSRRKPQLYSQDSTSNDRRRTQIRLAQRAYRQRKETTISTLTEKNAQLQFIIEQMHRRFLQFYELTKKTGPLRLTLDLSQEVANVAGTFDILLKSATDAPTETANRERATTVESEQPAESPPIDPSLVIRAPQIKRLQSSSPSNEQQPDIELDYAMRYLPVVPKLGSSNPDQTQPASYFSNISSSTYRLPPPNNTVRKERSAVEQVLSQSTSAEGLARLQYLPNHQHILPFGLVSMSSNNSTEELEDFNNIDFKF